jgi:hypothetical protein
VHVDLSGVAAGTHSFHLDIGPRVTPGERARRAST